MIKFFRKIRRQLIGEHRFSKYLLYAVGEIVLVVVGILIALQLDNWNENSKNATKEKEYLYGLKEDLDLFKMANTTLNSLDSAHQQFSMWFTERKYFPFNFNMVFRY